MKCFIKKLYKYLDETKYSIYSFMEHFMNKLYLIFFYEIIHIYIIIY